MNTDIIKVEAPEGLSIEQVSNVQGAFKVHIDRMRELEPRYKALTDIKLVEPTQEQVKEARSIRLALVKTRTGTAGTHKELKADALVYSRYLDGMKKAQEVACTKREADMLAIEKHYENLEKERVEKLRAERSELLGKLDIELMPAGLGQMEIDVWENYHAGACEDYKRRKEAERKADQAHREKIDASIVLALIGAGVHDGSGGPDMAKRVLCAINDGAIPNITINY